MFHNGFVPTVKSFKRLISMICFKRIQYPDNSQFDAKIVSRNLLKHNGFVSSGTPTRSLKCYRMTADIISNC